MLVICFSISSVLMSDYGCILKDVRSFSTSCVTNPVVEKYIDAYQKAHLLYGFVCANVTGTSDSISNLL